MTDFNITPSEQVTVKETVSHEILPYNYIEPAPSEQVAVSETLDITILENVVPAPSEQVLANETVQVEIQSPDNYAIDENVEVLDQILVEHIQINTRAALIAEADVPVRTMRFFYSESKINFNPLGIKELQYAEDQQLTTDLRAYTFGNVLDYPVSKDIEKYDRTEDTETNFIILTGDSYSGDGFVFLTPAERHSFISLNGKPHY